jgi:hypothetical protein
MQVTVDSFDRTTAYADLRDDERLTDDLRARAFRRARELGAAGVEFWRSPFGCGADRMAGFVELASVPTEYNPVEAVAQPAS